MAGLVPAIHVFVCFQDVDARHKAGHDAVDWLWQTNAVVGQTLTFSSSTTRCTAGRLSMRSLNAV